MNRDVGVTEFVRATLPEWTIRLFEYASLLGDERIVVAALALLATVDLYSGTRGGSDRLVSDRMGFVIAVVLGGLALTLTLKTLAGLSRPPTSLQAVPRDGSGFPSGHTMAATVFWGALVLWSDRVTFRRRVAVASVVVGLVAFSRLALGVHYLVDVITSVVFGVSYLLLVATLIGKKPATAFAGATLLGVVAILVTGGTTDGWLAFAGCVGATVGWWIVSRPSTRVVWDTLTSSDR